MFSEISLSTIGIYLIAILLNSVLLFNLLKPLRKVIRKCYSSYSDPIGRFIYTGRNDEIGQLELVLKQKDTECGAVIGRMSNDSKNIMHELDTINSNARNNVSSLQALYADNEQVAAAVDEMTSSIQEVSSNIQLTSEQAERANATAKLSQQVIGETVQSIINLSDELDESSVVIKKLEQDSNEINNVVDVIKSVAEQTNLLALNAAIEAARAGDQGRGFAVVADEVRTLATRTHESTEEIMSMVERLREAALNAVESMSKATNTANNTVKMTDEATSSIDSIVDSMGKISDMSTQIATAAEEQTIVSNDISENVNNVKLKTEQILENSRLSETICNRVFNTSSNLFELAQQFWRKRRASSSRA